MRGRIIKVSNGWEIADQAKGMVGSNIVYHLKYPNGGTNPLASEPCDPQTRYCDCIGFAAWCAGFDRYQPGKFPDTPSIRGGYINTDSMVEEATLAKLKQKNGSVVGGQRWFTVLEKPEPGCFIVSPSYRSKLRLGKLVVGHIGVVVECSEYAAKGLAGLQVVHCSSSNAKRPGNKNRSAVWKTDGRVWRNYPKVYFIRFNREYAMGLAA